MCAEGLFVETLSAAADALGRPYPGEDRDVRPSSQVPVPSVIDQVTRPVPALDRNPPSPRLEDAE
jgi:hypothetical protein